MEFVVVVGSGWCVLPADSGGVEMGWRRVGNHTGKAYWGRLSMLPFFPLVGQIRLTTSGELTLPSHLLREI